MQCTFVMPIAREKNLRSVIVFQMFLKTLIHETMLSAIFQKSASSGAQEQKVSEASDLYSFQKSPKEYVKNLSGSLSKTE